MGYQLWTSPITGYRRKGTRLSELRALIDAGITARAILEPLKSCPCEAPAGEIARELAQREFDVAGVQTCEDGPVVGFVNTTALTHGCVNDHTIPILAEHLISDSTPIPAVLGVLKKRQHVFVLIGSDVKGLVTRTDLNKPPFRIYLFGIISLLEMHLSFWIRREYDLASLDHTLSQSRRDAARKIEAERKDRGEETDLFDCLQLCDKRDLLLKHREICAKIGLNPQSDALKRLKRVESIRNLLAHNQQNLVSGSSWEEVIDHIEWIEAIVGRSDQLVEEFAAAAAESGSTVWSAA